jgi:hypothetical protein
MNYPANRKPRTSRDYALYKGDDLLMVGSVNEIADYLGIKPKSVYFLSYPSYHKRCEGSTVRVMVVPIEED